MRPINFSIPANLLQLLISCRYSVQVTGLQEIRSKGKNGILFLANHPAYIDPVIVMSQIHGRYKPRPFSAVRQIDKPILRNIIRHFRPIALADTGKEGSSAKAAIHSAMNQVVDSLRGGENILFYPAGRLTRSKNEDLAGKSGVEFILRNVPGVQVVLIRTSGLWGSSFSWASGQPPSISKHFWKYLKTLVCNGILFCPKRQIQLECTADNRLNQLQGRSQINRYLESFYNCKPVVSSHVPYFWWQRCHNLPNLARQWSSCFHNTLIYFWNTIRSLFL